MNPYYILIEGIRYYGPTPEKVVETVREHPAVKGSVRGEAIFTQASVPAPQQTALPSGRTMKNRTAGAWQSMKSGASALGNKVSSTASSARNKLRSPTSGPTMKNRASAAAGRTGTAMRSGMGRAANLARRGINATKKTFTRSPAASGASSPAATTGPKRGFLGRGKVNSAPKPPVPSEKNTTPLLSPEGLA